MGLWTRFCAVDKGGHSSCFICTCGRKDEGRERNLYQVCFVILSFKTLKFTCFRYTVFYLFITF